MDTNKEAPSTARRSEKAGILNFSREMISALIMAFIAIVYVIQAFRIPTGSMEESLKVGDFLLGLKFMYGAPALPIPNTYWKLPGLTDPKPGDVIIFKYPGYDRKDYIKRCVAGPGQTIEIHGKQVLVDGKEVVLPPKGQYIAEGRLDQRITDFTALTIPAKGDTLSPANMPIREFLFFKHLVQQENPNAKVAVQYQLYLNGELADNRQFPIFGRTVTLAELHQNTHEVPNMRSGRKEYLNLNNIDDWLDLDSFLGYVKSAFATESPQIRPVLYLNGKLVESYVVKKDNYFMMGDNRDNSKDSRYWGYLNRNFIKAKAFILYFSVDLAKRDENGRQLYYNNMPQMLPFYHFPLHIRWERIGKLIRSFYQTQEAPATPAGPQPSDGTTGIDMNQSSQPDSNDQAKGELTAAVAG